MLPLIIMLAFTNAVPTPLQALAKVIVTRSTARVLHVPAPTPTPAGNRRRRCEIHVTTTSAAKPRKVCFIP